MTLFSLFVGHLPAQATKEDLVNLFSECGDIKDVALILKEDMPFSFAFVRFSEAECVLKATQQIVEWTLHGVTLKVQIANQTRTLLQKFKPPKNSLTRTAALRDNSHRSRLKEACFTINKELDLVYGDKPVDSVWLMGCLEKASLTYPPRVEGIPCHGKGLSKNYVFNTVGAFADKEEPTVEKLQKVKNKLLNLLNIPCSEVTAKDTESDGNEENVSVEKQCGRKQTTDVASDDVFTPNTLHHPTSSCNSKELSSVSAACTNRDDVGPHLCRNRDMNGDKDLWCGQCVSPSFNKSKESELKTAPNLNIVMGGASLGSTRIRQSPTNNSRPFPLQPRSLSQGSKLIQYFVSIFKSKGSSGSSEWDRPCGEVIKKAVPHAKISPHCCSIGAAHLCDPQSWETQTATKEDFLDVTKNGRSYSVIRPTRSPGELSDSGVSLDDSTKKAEEECRADSPQFPAVLLNDFQPRLPASYTKDFFSKDNSPSAKVQPRIGSSSLCSESAVLTGRGRGKLINALKTIKEKREQEKRPTTSGFSGAMFSGGRGQALLLALKK